MAASSNTHRNVMPNYLIQWTMIRWAKSKGCTLYDFRVSPVIRRKTIPVWSFKFKKGFNGKLYRICREYDLVYSPFYYWLWHTAEPMYQRGIGS